MRKELYAAIKAKIEGEVPEVKHVDLWNHNVEFIEQETAWARPAVFVEFGTITWSAFHGGGQRGRGVVRVHLVTDWVEGGYEAAFDLGRKLYGVLEGMDGECFDGMALVETSTNHNHEEILESVDSYAVRYLLRRLVPPVATGAQLRRDESRLYEGGGRGRPAAKGATPADL